MPAFMILLILLIPVYFLLRLVNRMLARILAEVLFSGIIYWVLYSFAAEIELSGGRLHFEDYLILVGISIAPVLLARLIGLIFSKFLKRRPG